jgi:hypothetical protein
VVLLTKGFDVETHFKINRSFFPNQLTITTTLISGVEVEFYLTDRKSMAFCMMLKRVN